MVRFPRRMTAALALAVAAGTGLSTPAAAATGAPVELVVGLHPGASADAPAEALAGSVRVLDTDAEAAVRAVVVDVPARDAAEATAALREDPAVAFVEPNHRAAKTDVTPDDPFYPKQWGLRKINLPGTWSMTTGDPAITVAVLDTGVNEVSELRGRIQAGYDFVNNDTNAADDEGHGTAVASIIAAAGDGAGMAGVCWSCQILPVKVLDDEGSGDYLAIAKGIRYAVDNGADIINMSLAGESSSSLFNSAVQYATDNGVLIVAAAGNENTTRRQYPAAIPQVLSVGGSTSTDARYSWSNHGGWVDVAAPGCNVAQDYRGRGYLDFCGTSSASPVVAGVAALALARNPAASGAFLSTVLSLSSGDLSWVNHGRVNAGRAVWAVADTAAPTVSFGAPAAGKVLRGTVTVTASGADNTGLNRIELVAGNTVVSVDKTAPYSLTWASGGSNGDVKLTVRAVDWTGRTASVTRPFVTDNRGPSLTVTAPANRAKVKKTVSITVAASDPHGIAKVELLVNGKVVGSGTSFKLKTKKYGKSFKVRVRAYDKAGNVSYSPTRTWKR